MSLNFAGKKEFDLSVLLVNYNHGDFILSCLQSIIRNTSNLSYEIIVVDNKSVDHSCQLVRKELPQVRIIENRKNLGFARAVNQAYQVAKGKYLLILNPDIQALPGSIEKMIIYLFNHSGVGLVLPKLVNPDGSLQYSCRTFYSLPILLFRRTPLGNLVPNHPTTRHHLMADWDHSDTREVDWGLGACMLIRREAIRGPLLMDEKFFLYFEDMDLCVSLKKTGWKVVYFPEAVMVHHHLRQSANGFFNRAKWEHFISLIKFYFKHRRFSPPTS